MATDNEGDEEYQKSVILYDISEVFHWKQTDSQKYSQINGVLRAIVDGMYDENSILSLLNGTPEIVQSIWDELVAWWKTCIRERTAGWWEDENSPAYGHAFTKAYMPMEILNHHSLKFPEPTGIRINMMPFVMARTFAESKLPKHLKPYWDAFFDTEFWISRSYDIVTPLIAAGQVGKVGYLTIDESFVEAGTTQRRPGLHTDCPGKLMFCRKKKSEKYICLGRVIEENKEAVKKMIDNKLGHGYAGLNTVDSYHSWSDEGTALEGGIYMASNVDNSCEVWNCTLQLDAEGKEVIGSLGDVEHLREVLPGEPLAMKANTVYWIRDRTPYESLPLKEGTYRQYFRLVTSEVSIWFEEHSTKNPCGVVPDPNVTMIVKGSKFEDDFALLDLKTPIKGERKSKKHDKCAVA